MWKIAPQSVINGISISSLQNLQISSVTLFNYLRYSFSLEWPEESSENSQLVYWQLCTDFTSFLVEFTKFFFAWLRSSRFLHWVNNLFSLSFICISRVVFISTERFFKSWICIAQDVSFFRCEDRFSLLQSYTDLRDEHLERYWCFLWGCFSEVVFLKAYNCSIETLKIIPIVFYLVLLSHYLPIQCVIHCRSLSLFFTLLVRLFHFQ